MHRWPPTRMRRYARGSRRSISSRLSPRDRAAARAGQRRADRRGRRHAACTWCSSAPARAGACAIFTRRSPSSTRGGGKLAPGVQLVVTPASREVRAAPARRRHARGVRGDRRDDHHRRLRRVLRHERRDSAATARTCCRRRIATSRRGWGTRPRRSTSRRRRRAAAAAADGNDRRSACTSARAMIRARRPRAPPRRQREHGLHHLVHAQARDDRRAGAQAVSARDGRSGVRAPPCATATCSWPAATSAVDRRWRSRRP